MSIELTGEFSPEKIYEQSATAVQEERAGQNSYSPYEFVDDESSVVSISNYVNEYYQMKLPIEENLTDENYFGEETDNSAKVEEDLFADYVAHVNSNIGGGVVNDALKSGYDTENAIRVGKAQKAYSDAARLPRKPVKSTLLTEFNVN